MEAERLAQALLALLIFTAPLPCAAADDTLGALTDALREGAWNDRIRAVNQLGAMGGQAEQALRSVLSDPDWQVRFAAVHWLGRRGSGSRPSLERLVRSEGCPLVRMSALHWLARMGREPAPLKEAGSSDRLRDCESWFWPVSQDFLRSRGKTSKVVVATPPDSRGCVYVRYRRAGKTSCPAGTQVRGVGPAPGSVELLEETPPDSGVALCCPAETAQVPSAEQAPTPEEAECRLVPEECPAGWVEMAPDGESLSGGKGPRLKRTKQQKEGNMAWLHCCRKTPAPPREEPQEEPPGPQWERPDPEQRIAGLPLIEKFNLAKALGRMPEPKPASGFQEGSGTAALKLPAPVQSLLETLKRGGRKERESAALALARLGSEAAGAAERLAPVLREDPSPRVRACAALALASVSRGTDAGVGYLSEALKDPHAGVRYSAAQSLGVVGTPAAEKAFLSSLRAEAVKFIQEGE
ncbi:MAG: HEAT repeat domain-containing protein [Elusimicrobia bacterium]|nr:HEAT repeat domain-containing protein [Elusimicrobiota bacterium]